MRSSRKSLESIRDILVRAISRNDNDCWELLWHDDKCNKFFPPLYAPLDVVSFFGTRSTHLSALSHATGCIRNELDKRLRWRVLSAERGVKVPSTMAKELRGTWKSFVNYQHRTKNWNRIAKSERSFRAEKSHQEKKRVRKTVSHFSLRINWDGANCHVVVLFMWQRWRERKLGKVN